jgi:AcrR family transcriptional regulator
MDELQKILDAAENLFRKYGTRSITMSDIAQQLGMSKKTLYQYIENKDDLVDRVAERHIEADLCNIQSLRTEAENALDEMLRILLHVQKTIENINPALIFDLQRYHRSTWLKFERHRFDYVLEIIESNLWRGIQEGLYRSDLKPEVIGKIYLSSIPIFADQNLFPLEGISRADLHFEFVNYHVHGIVSPKGLELWKSYLQNIGK